MPKELAIIESDAFHQIEKVAELYAKGITSPHTIGRRLGIKAVEARAAIEQWHIIVRNDMEARDAAKDYLHAMVQRYDTLIREANDNLDNLKSLDFDEKVGAQVNATLRVIGDLDAKRVDALQKAGLLEANDLGDELAEREENEKILVDILRNDLCADCQRTVARRLQEVTGVVEAVVVHE